MPPVDMTHWTPASVMIVCSGLLSLIGAITGGIVSVVHAIKGGQDVANNAVNAVKDSVPSATVHAMFASQSQQPSSTAAQVNISTAPDTQKGEESGNHTS